MSLGIVADRLPVHTLERAFKIMILFKTFIGYFASAWEFWANNLKSRLQLKHVPVHETHSAMVGEIITTSKTPIMNRIESAQQISL